MNKICEYGCDKIAEHELKNGKWCCSKRTSSCDGQKKLNSAALITSWAEGNNGYDYNALPEETKIRMSGKGVVTMTADEVFIDGKEWGSELLRKYLHHYKLKEYVCSNDKCNITDWHGEHLTLELDHINGKRGDNRLENLRWLCPNCHSQTPTFRGYNKSNTGKVKVTDDELLTALAKCSNIRQALQSVGLAAKGGNYERANKLFNKLPVAKQTD